MEEPTLIAPAPWSLTGNGMVLLYHFSGSFIDQYGFLESYQEAGFKGWLGAVMLNCYQTSNVGPYYELLFIPGLFRLGGKLCYSVSKIYVSSLDSARNGWQNWGIPKEIANFKVSNLADGSQVFEVGPPPPGQFFFQIHFKKRGWPLPFTSKLVPLNRLVQQAPASAQLLLTKPQATGQAQLCAVQHLLVNPKYFPPLNKLRLLAAFYLPQFKINFPVPQILPGKK
jgi:hypothetical protein